MPDETKTLGSATRNNISLFYQSIDMPGGYKFDTAETIKKSLAYYDGEFLKGKKDKLGVKKNFFNITKSTCDVATKFIDLDTKDIMFLSTGGSWEWVWLIQKDFKN